MMGSQLAASLTNGSVRPSSYNPPVLQSPLDRWDVGSIPDEVTGVEVVKTPDSLSRTASFRLPRLTQYLEAGNEIAVGQEIVMTGRSSQDPSDVLPLMRGQIVDKFIREVGGAKGIDVNLVDHTYSMTRCGFRRSIYSKTFTQELYLFFKDDGSGAGAPTQYVRKSEMRVKNGSDYYVPFEDMDNIPLHSVRRSKDAERSVFLPYTSYEVQNVKKELVFKAAQVDKDDPTLALPKDYVTGTPNPPDGVDGTDNDNWTYKAVASFFVAPDFPQRNISENTFERIMRDVLVGDPDSEEGGGGYDQSMLELTFTYTKGAPVTIPDRIDEGMRVTAYVPRSSDITVSDGAAWAGKTSLSYTDAQRVPRTATIGTIVGDVITLTAPPVGMVTGLHVKGCDQLGIIVTLSGVGETTEDMVNYTDVEIGGDSYFIREIRDATTLVLVNVDETGDFTGLAAGGTLTYPTLEYTGLQIAKLKWNKDAERSIADFLQYCYDHYLAPINYHIRHHPRNNVITGRNRKQYRAEVTGVVTIGGGISTIPVDDVDGFYPGKQLAWRDDSGERVVFVITEIDYANEAILVDGDATAMDVGDIIHANCKLIYRQTGAEHGLTLETLAHRCEVISGANQSFPVLTLGTSVTVAAAPVSPHGGSWAITGTAADVVDDNPETFWMLRWQHTAAGALEGDPSYWGMDPIPWTVLTWDLGAVDTYYGFVLSLGYPKDDIPKVLETETTELPMATVIASRDGTNWTPVSKDCVSREFNVINPSQNVSLFLCDLLDEFQHIGIAVNRPFFYKAGESLFGTPTRRRDFPIASFQLYKKPEIKYIESDENVSQDNGSPTGQITPYIGQHPFATVTNQGGTISLIAGLVLTVGAGHGFANGDAVTFFDTSAGVPFTTATTVSAHTATTITVGAVPGGLANGDKVGGLRRWLLDPLGRWLDHYMPTVKNQMMQFTRPPLVIEDESPQNGWDAQQIASLRLFEANSSVRDGTGQALHDIHIEEFDTVWASDMYEPEMVMGITFQGYQMTAQLRDYNSTAEEIAST